MQFILTINVDNAAFYPEDDEQDGNEAMQGEISRILFEAADRVACGEVTGKSLRDINGNVVGSYNLAKESQ